MLTFLLFGLKPNTYFSLTALDSNTKKAELAAGFFLFRRLINTGTAEVLFDRLKCTTEKCNLSLQKRWWILCRAFSPVVLTQKRAKIVNILVCVSGVL